tara:strand:- start:718 stop:1665 length:948 start_codon:yes stop_codon:yes gene_type:complete
MNLELTILGCNSAIPLINRNPTSQFLSIHSRQFLIDCGEGTQIRLRENGIGFGRINHILISHLHGDHCFGLVPLLSSLHLLDRHKEIHIYGPSGLKNIVNLQMKAQGSWLKFPLIFHELVIGKKELIFEDEKILVHSFPLDHGINCWGFLFEEKPLPKNIIPERIKELSIPIPEIKKIKNGEDWQDENGKTYKNSYLCTKGPDSLSYAFCTDTLPLENLGEYINKPPSLLYHEATFLNDQIKRAKQTNHTTAKQAGEIAKRLNCDHLIIGHFSARYSEFEAFQEEASTEFENTHLAVEGRKYSINHKQAKKLIIE